MTVNAGDFGFYCVRCGQPYADRHPIHPEDRGEPPKLCRPAELQRRQDALAGRYGWSCPTCAATSGMWCIGEGGESLLDMHPERRI
jgi:hypothetical protein